MVVKEIRKNKMLSRPFPVRADNTGVQFHNQAAIDPSGVASAIKRFSDTKTRPNNFITCQTYDW